MATKIASESKVFLTEMNLLILIKLNIYLTISYGKLPDIPLWENYLMIINLLDINFIGQLNKLRNTNQQKYSK